jgi:hypothetical protein
MQTKIFTLLFALLLAASGIYAQRAVPSGSIQIVSQRSETLRVEVSGLLLFRENVQGGVLLSNLMPGEYRVRISGAQGGRRGGANNWEQQLQILPGQRTVINISANNRTSVTSVADPNSLILCVDAGGNRPPSRPPHAVHPISDADLDRMLSALRGRPFDREKLEMLDVSATFHFYTSAQLRRILALFDFDSNRLQCARLLIPHVLDPENLFLQADVFIFRSNRESFLNLIREMR